MTDAFLTRFEENRKAREQADRSFVLLGEKLVFRAHVPYEIGRALEEARQKFAADLMEAQRRLEAANGKPPDLSDLNINTDELVQAADEQILSCLEQEGRDAWARLRALDSEHPLNFHEIGQIADYLLGRVTAIPTVAPVGSSGGRKKTEAKSTAGSSSRGSRRGG